MKVPNFLRLFPKLLALATATFVMAVFLLTSEPSKWFSRYSYSSISPDERYRLESWDSFFSSNHGFSRLYESQTIRLMCESQVEFLNGNGWIVWPDPSNNRVRVGMDIWLALSADGQRCKSLQFTDEDPLFMTPASKPDLLEMLRQSPPLPPQPSASQ